MNKKFYKKTKMLDSSASNPITDENVVSQEEEESNQNSTVLFSKLASSATDSSSKLPGTTDLQANKTKGKRGRIASTAEPSSDTEIKKGKSTKASVVSDDWNYNYSALLEYGREFGHCNVPPEVQYQCILEGVGENGSDLQYEGSLGQWLQNEVSILRGRITAKTAHTRPYFQQLVDEGKLEAFDSRKLITGKKNKSKDQEDEPMTEEEKEAAKAAKKVKRSRDPEDTDRKRNFSVYDWNINFNALLCYRNQVGNCYVAQKAIFECDLPGMGEGGTDLHFVGRLGKWLDNQRQFKKRNKLSADRENLLQELVDQGVWTWKATDKFNDNGGDVWARHYAALLEYCRQYDTCNIAQKDIFKCDLPGLGMDGGILHYEGALGKWLDNQRRKAHQGKMHKEREMRLQALSDQGKLLWRIRKAHDYPSENA